MKMTEKEAGLLLLTIQDFIPNFRPGQTTAASWRRVLGKKMTYPEAAKYLDQHFESSRFQPLPADLISLWQADFNPDDIIPVSPPEDLRGGQSSE
ncbi:hypothetical protein [Paenibacillus odorifer]|uniref:hypothetical protein n=1 Tax=Paenibacillus odorifer TaxID=189426 RepID=UPI00096E9EB9|nr:hypothetical protein [Paenibacillus odorifer]OME23394.1 hypothetical protein BSK57_16410 [Paenibacillus odorifer]